MPAENVSGPNQGGSRIKLSHCRCQWWDATGIKWDGEWRGGSIPFFNWL